MGEAKGDGSRIKTYFVPMNYTNLTAQERLNYESVRVDLRFAEQAAGVMGVVFKTSVGEYFQVSRSINFTYSLRSPKYQCPVSGCGALEQLCLSDYFPVFVSGGN